MYKNYTLKLLTAFMICLAMSQAYGQSQALRPLENPHDRLIKDTIVKVAPWVAPICIMIGLVSNAFCAAVEHTNLVNYTAKLKADKTALEAMKAGDSPVTLKSASWLQWLRGNNKVMFDAADRQMRFAAISQEFDDYDYQVKNISSVYAKSILRGLLVGGIAGAPLHLATSALRDEIKNSRDPWIVFTRKR